MALMGTVKLSELMTWGSWRKKDVITDIPDTKVINNSYKKLKSQLKNMTENIMKYLICTVINYGEEGYDNSYYLDVNIKFGNDKINQIIITNEKKLFISLYDEMYYRFLQEFELDDQIKIMNKVEEKISKMEIKHRTNFKF